MGIFDGFKNLINFITMFPDPDDLYGERVEHVKEIQKRRNYREGIQDPQLKVKFNKPDDNVNNNIIGRAINQSLKLLLGKGVEFDLPGEPGTPEDEWLKACWEANKKNLLMTDAFLNAADGKCGFIKLQKDGVMGLLDGKEALFPRMIVQDPMWLSMDTNPEDYEQVIRYTIKYGTKGADGKDIARKQVIENIGEQYNPDGVVVDEGGYWMVTDYQNDDSTGGKWVKIGEYRWEYGFAPMIHWKNLPNPNDTWGKPDATADVINLQDKLNFNLSNMNKIIRYHAHPQTIGKGIGNKSELDKSVDGMFLLSNPEADIFNLEMKSDLKGNLDVLDYLGKSILDNTDTVNINNLKDKMGQLTNFAVKVMFFDALGKMHLKREIWTAMLTDLNQRLFEVGTGKIVDVGEVVWPDSVLPVNEKELSDLYKNDLEQGLVSEQTISERRGYVWEVEQERMNEKELNTGDIGAELLRSFNRGEA